MQTVLAKNYARLVSALGTEHLASELMQVINATLPVDELFAFERAFGDTHQFLVAAGPTPVATHRLTAQHHRFRAFDPLTRVIVGRDGPELLTLKLRVEQIANPIYRHECYEKNHYSERISLAARHDRGWSVVNLYRSAEHRTASDTTLADLQELAQLAIPLIARHVSLTQGASSVNSLALITARLAAIYPELAAREREVLAHTLTGESARTIGAALGIASTSVLTYRRRAYEKLQISSAAQLTGALLRQS